MKGLTKAWDSGSYRQYVNPELAQLLEALRLDKTFVWGEGTRIRDSAGREYLDFLAGYGAVPFGHNPTPIWDAINLHRELSEPGIIQPSVLEPAARLAERLIDLAPSGLERVCFTNSGAEAVEAAIKACRAATGRLGIVAATNSFHGKTLGALSATGAPKYQRGFGAPAPDFTFVPYGNAGALEAAMQAREGQIAAIILEPIQGEGGIVVPPPGYLAAAREIADRHRALLIIDEVQTGLGRTGAMFACETAGVLPDCLTLAKALGGGIVPIGACLLSASAWSETFALRHSSTFAANALACRVGLAAINFLARNRSELLENVRQRGKQLCAVHERLRARFPNVVAEARGEGLLLGIAFNVRGESFPSGWGAYLGILGEQGNIVPLLASYLLNVESIRTAPTLNGSNVLRVEPPLTVTEVECDAYAIGIQRAVELLAEGNTAALAAHLVDARPQSLSPHRAPFMVRHKAKPQPGPDEGRFAFLVHPLDTNSLTDFDKSLELMHPGALASLGDRISGFLEPFPIGATRIQTDDGTKAFGEFICVPWNAREMQRLSPAEACKLVGAAVDLARDRGAKIVGLGGYTSVVTGGGQRVCDRGVAITTGNSYTVVSAIEAVDLACRRLSIALDAAEAVVVGAGGAIGASATERLFDNVGGLTLVGRASHPAKTRRRFEAVLQRCITRLLAHGPHGRGRLARLVLAHPHAPSPADGEAAARAFAALLLDENGARIPLRWSFDISERLPAAEVVVCATSSAEAIILPEYVCQGAVLCDISRPANVSQRFADERPDVLVLDGGIVEIPGRPDFGFNVGLPRGLGYACLAETMMLGLNRSYQHISIGCDLSWEHQALLTELAGKYGFRLAGLRSFHRPLLDLDWNSLRQRRRAVPIVARTAVLRSGELVAIGGTKELVGA